MKLISRVLGIAVGCVVSFSIFAATVPDSIYPITGSVTIAGGRSVTETTKDIIQQLKHNEMEIKAVIDHQKIAKSIGHDVRPTMAVLFGKPEFEYPLIKADQRVALFVPMTFVIWQDEQGKTEISYWDPSTDILPLVHVKNPTLRNEVKKMSAEIAMVAQHAAALRPSSNQ